MRDRIGWRCWQALSIPRVAGRRGLVLGSLVAAACAGGGPAERYGFVATLGVDTVSVERVARTARKLVIDGVDRFPYVRLRHTEFDLAPDGKLARMVMEV
ncbi:MAG: hypothetical protein JNJ98_14980, partial [Gemmatimonadetes bacterium]|nr:hypothetical protein [Gemmatimonadota bacterium]